MSEAFCVKSIQVDKRVNTRKDNVLSNIIVQFLYALIINNVFKRILGIEQNYLLYIGVLFTLIYSFANYYILSKKCTNTFIISAVICIAFYATSYIFYGNPFSTILKYVSQTIVFIYYGSIAFNIDDYSILFDKLTKHSYIFLIILSLILIGRDNYVYVMSYSNLVLIPLILHTICFFKSKKNKLLNLAILVYEAILIIMLGSRGALLVYAVFLFAYILFALNRATIKVLFVMIVALIVFIFVVYSDLIAYLLEKFGINSRTIMLLLNDFTHDSGRTGLHEYGRYMIDQKPLLGWGVAGDSQFMGGGYVHSIWLELQIDFGRIIGIALFLTICALYIYVLLNTHFDYKFLMFICLGFVQLFYSNSYLICWEFILSIYIFSKECIVIRENKKNNRAYTINQYFGFRKICNSNT